jgi:hypothetical protein
MATNVIDRGADANAVPITNDESVYRQRKDAPPFNDVPATIYFYYVGAETPGGPLEVKHYFYIHGRDLIYDIGPDSDLEERVRALALNARNNGNNPPQCGADWEYIVWNHKSYFVILLDDPNIQFEPRNALKFKIDVGGAPNHSFFDGRNLDVPLPNRVGGGMRSFSAFCCINHMKRNDDGADLGDNPEYFNFVLNTQPPPDGSATRSMLDDPGTGGTNMGPPAPPPGFTVAGELVDAESEVGS